MAAISAILDGPPGDGVAEWLTLFDLCCCKRACRSMRAWADEAIELRGGVTRADVDAGVHARALHWLVSKSSQRRITLAAGTYMLGDLEDPTHVYNARPPTYDEDDSAEEMDWLNWEPEWRQGYGPLTLSRPLTLVGNHDVTLTASLNLSAVEVIGEPRSAADRTDPNGMPMIRPSGYTSVAVRLEGLNLGFLDGSTDCFILYVGACACQHAKNPDCSCTPYGGPILTAHDCGFYGSMDFDRRVEVTGDSVMDFSQLVFDGPHVLTVAASVKCVHPTCKGRLHPNPNGDEYEIALPGCDCYYLNDEGADESADDDE